ncbi:hypothetical protein AB0L63_20715 [Nocardia sp. NPDC051990]|uniref:hypothetical protein n=1 Tax=Nocardia sp. NPDC051990 TaxID=3155285 RepID=UPI003436A06D
MTDAATRQPLLDFSAIGDLEPAVELFGTVGIVVDDFDARGSYEADKRLLQIPVAL